MQSRGHERTLAASVPSNASGDRDSDRHVDGLQLLYLGFRVRRPPWTSSLPAWQPVQGTWARLRERDMTILCLSFPFLPGTASKCCVRTK